MRCVFLFLLFSILTVAYSQTYTSYRVGAETSIHNPSEEYGIICLMGGAGDNDDACRVLLEGAAGGDVLVLRASGSDGYNAYFYSDLGVTVNSVETIVFNTAEAASDPYVIQRIQEAEAIWFAGGDQWDYVSYWRNTPVDSLINTKFDLGELSVGGTSAGMAILGDYYFSAENGTVTSETALNNPYDEDVTVDSTTFLSFDILQNTVTDTHYDDPDRKGRHATFLARIAKDYDTRGYGIACDEYTAVCIFPSGEARVYGNEDYEDYAYFIQTNCMLPDYTPENCTADTPLNWNKDGEALITAVIRGTESGINFLDLNTWTTGAGITWENWYVMDGELVETPRTAPICDLGTGITLTENYALYPNPASTQFTLTGNVETTTRIELVDLNGNVHETWTTSEPLQLFSIPERLAPGLYFIRLHQDNGLVQLPLTIVH